MPLVSLGAVAYSCYSKGVPLFMADGQCVICLCNLGPAPAEILSCGHVPWAPRDKRLAVALRLAMSKVLGYTNEDRIVVQWVVGFDNA